MSGLSARSRALPAVLATLCACTAGASHVRARGAQTAATPVTAAPPSPSTPTRDVLDQYCVTCHNARLKTAGLQLDSLDVAQVADHAQQWEKVVTKLRTGEMPPPGRPRPAAETYRSVIAALEQELDAAAAAKPDPGRVPVHRLNRSEYANAVRDL